MRLLTGIRARWIECPTTEPRVYYANHSSHLDAIVIWASLPKSIRRLTRPVAAKEYWERNVLRRYLANKVFNAILIDRNQPRAARQTINDIVDAIQNNFSIIIFPEGTRGSGQDIKPFQMGIYHIAKAQPQAVFTPIYLDNLNRTLPKGEVLPVPMLGSATFGPSIKLETDELKKTFVSRARESVLALKG